MRRAASAMASVTVGSSPSGTFATMMPMAKTRLTEVDRPMNRPITNTTRPIATASAAITRLRAAISFCSGDGGSTVVWVRWAILPKAVCIPVAKTSAFASPLVTEVPASSTLRLRSRSVSTEGRASRDTGRASPVTVALLTRTPKPSTSRQSAGTSSPAVRKMTSPGTTSSDASTTVVPFRSALTWCGSRRCSAAIVSSARYSCQNEKAPLIAITATIAAASVAMP